MTRPEMRDYIRVSAEIPGEDTFDVVINQYINQELRRCTALRKYDEMKLIDQDVAFVGAGTPYVLLPTTLQHLDEENLFYIPDSTDDPVELWFLRKWSKWFNQNDFGPFQYRLSLYNDSGTLKRAIQILPEENIDFTNARIRFNYWRIFTWDDTTEFPIPTLEPSVQDAVAARIASLQKTNLAMKLKGQAKEAYIAAQAVGEF